MTFVHIAGSPFECGRQLGALQAGPLRSRLAAFHERLAAPAVDRAALYARAEVFAACVRQVAPHWLEEVRGMAEAAAVEARDLLCLNCLPPGFHEARMGQHCTGFVSVGPEQVLLFKIRDLRNQPQAYLTECAEGTLSFQCGRTIGDLGVGHAINTACVAGACHTGSHTLRVDDAPRLDDCHVLRLLVESARSVEEIPGLYEALAAGGYAGGAGPGRGALYLFADVRQALLLEAAGRDFEATFLASGTRALSNHFLTPRAQSWWSRPPDLNTSRRYERMSQLTAAASGGQPSPAEVFRVSRDRRHHPHCLCNDDRRHVWMTVSAQLHVLERRRPEESLTWVCCGNTRQSVYVPVPLAERDCFVPWADGRFYGCAEALYRRQCCVPALGAEQARFERHALGCPRQEWRGLPAAAFGLLQRAAGDRLAGR